MVALADALIAYAPPQKPVEFEWPGTIWVDRGLIGGARLAWPQDADEDQPAPWLVFGAMVRTVSLTEEPGLTPLAAALENEGFDDLGSERLVESFARHLMVAFDSWEESGFAAVARSYLPRLQPEKGARRDIDENGDLIVRWVGPGEPERRSFTAAMATPSWLDPATGGPRT
jgi:hypothetical protein